MSFEESRGDRYHLQILSMFSKTNKLLPVKKSMQLRNFDPDMEKDCMFGRKLIVNDFLNDNESES